MTFLHSFFQISSTRFLKRTLTRRLTLFFSVTKICDVDALVVYLTRGTGPSYKLAQSILTTKTIEKHVSNIKRECSPRRVCFNNYLRNKCFSGPSLHFFFQFGKICFIFFRIFLGNQEEGGGVRKIDPGNVAQFIYLQS